MGSYRSSLPIKNELLARPRVSQMLKRAAQNPLVTIIAGPGYGKTCEAARFASQTDNRLIWMHINRLDNIADHFWKSLANALSGEFSNLAKIIESSEFPNTAVKFDAFLHSFAGEIYGGSHVLFIVDDFGHITNNEIRYFFDSLIEAKLENFCLMLISAVKTDIGLVGLRHGGLFQVTANDLKFTSDETAALFAQYGHELTEDKLTEIERHVDGWPMALYLLTQRFGPDTIYAAGRASLDIIYAMFEKEFFSNYSGAIQRLLIKLSMIPGFSENIIKRVGENDLGEALGVVNSNIFIAFDSSSLLCTFQNVYRDFLVSKQDMLEERDRRALWSAAGDAFYDRGNNFEAIDCFEKCGRFDKMLQSIAEFSKTHVTYSRERANFFLEKLSGLPDEFVSQNPLAEFIRASALANNLEFDAAEKILHSLLPRLSGGDSESLILRGEIYWAIGVIHLRNNLPDHAKYFELSSGCLPDGSPWKSSYQHIGNMDMFGVSSDLPGERERMERAIHEAMPHFIKVAKGGGSGLDDLFSAEACYFTFDFDAARQNAHKAIYAAMEASQHDVLCNAHIILSRIALMSGDYDGLRKHCEFVRDYIDEREITALYEMRDCAIGFLYVVVGDLGRLPLWLTSPDMTDRNRPPVAGSRDRMIQAEYLMYVEKYYEAIAFLDHYEKLYRRQGRWANALKCLIMLSVALLRTGETNEAVAALKEAYDKSRQNGVITPFVECADNMRLMIDHARKSETVHFDADWLNDIQRKSVIFAKRLAFVAGEHFGQAAKSEAPEHKLSKREMGVLGCLSQGLTRDEIADANNISVNTVKSVISSVYNKLGAVNRADAVRIATALGILK
jgi:LuxR family maltose regulon positive regulatory protein